MSRSFAIPAFSRTVKKYNKVSKVFLPPAPDILSGKNCSSCHCLPLPSDHHPHHHHHLPLNRHRNHVCKIGGIGNWHRTAIITRSVSSTGWSEKPRTQTEVSNLFQNICQHCIIFYVECSLLTLTIYHKISVILWLPYHFAKKKLLAEMGGTPPPTNPPP